MRNYTSDEPALINVRNKARLTRRIAFDCKNCHSKDGRAYCTKHKFYDKSEDGTYALHKVLQNWTPRKCQMCQDYESMGGMEE